MLRLLGHSSMRCTRATALRSTTRGCRQWRAASLISARTSRRSQGRQEDALVFIAADGLTPLFGALEVLAGLVSVPASTGYRGCVTILRMI